MCRDKGFSSCLFSLAIIGSAFLLHWDLGVLSISESQPALLYSNRYGKLGLLCRLVLAPGYIHRAMFLHTTHYKNKKMHSLINLV